MNGTRDGADLGEDWLTTGQAARRMERSPARVRQLIVAKQLETLETPYGSLVKRGSVDAHVKARDAKGGGRGDGR